MIKEYQEKHDGIGHIFLLTQNITKALDEEEWDEKAIMALLEQRKKYMDQIDQLDQTIQAGQPVASEAAEVEKLKSVILTITQSTLELERKNEEKLQQFMDQLKENMRELAQNKKEITAYVPLPSGSAHIDVSQ